LARQTTGVALKDESGAGSAQRLMANLAECDKSAT
jgi:hypothetical protein